MQGVQHQLVLAGLRGLLSRWTHILRGWVAWGLGLGQQGASSVLVFELELFIGQDGVYLQFGIDTWSDLLGGAVFSENTTELLLKLFVDFALTGHIAFHKLPTLL